MDILIIEILNDGILKPRKGINLPDSKVSAAAFTKEDKKNLMFGIKNEVDYFALSFVGNAEDIKGEVFTSRVKSAPKKLWQK